MLEVRDLTCTRGGAAVLAGVTLKVGAGQGLVLRGPNGIGKTTLLRTLAGLQPALKGDVIADTDSTAYASHADGVKEALSVRENLAFWAEVHGSTLDDAAFDHFDIADLKDRIAGTLSAGQKRRLGLARLAVVNRPVLLLDEPTESALTAGSAPCDPRRGRFRAWPRVLSDRRCAGPLRRGARGRAAHQDRTGHLMGRGIARGAALARPDFRAGL